MINMYQNSFTSETLVSLFKQSDVVLARLQEVKWQHNTSLHCWCLHHSSYVNKRINHINTQHSNRSEHTDLLCSHYCWTEYTSAESANFFSGPYYQWWKYKFRGPGTVTMMGAPCFGIGPSPNCSRFKSHVKNLSLSDYFQIFEHHMQCRHTNTFAFVEKLFFLLSFPLPLIPWRTVIAVNITAQQHMILSFLLHFCPGHLELSHIFLQYSVPRSAFKDFCITRLRRLSALENRRANNWDQRLKAV